MDKENFAVRCGLRVAGISGQIERFDCSFNRLSGEYAALADLTARFGAGTPEFMHDGSEGGFIVSKRRIVGGRFADDGRPLLDELLYATEDRQGHMSCVLIKDEHAVAHAAFRNECVFVDAKFMFEDVGVDVIEVVAGGDVRRVVSEDGGDV